MATEGVIHTRKRGDNYDLLATIYLNGAVTDVTGATAIQLLVDDKKEVAAGSVPSKALAGAISDGPNGVFSFDMTNTGTPIDLSAGKYYAEITYLNSAGKRLTTDTFEFVIKANLRGQA